jgi:hypothetical protein
MLLTVLAGLETELRLWESNRGCRLGFLQMPRDCSDQYCLTVCIAVMFDDMTATR